MTQNWAVSTVRNNEVVSDPTNVLALECASRRRRHSRAESEAGCPIHIAARHRVLRPQFYNNPPLSTHFSLFSLVSAGRDLGNRTFEISALFQHLTFYIRILQEFLGPKWKVSVRLSDFASKNDSERLDRSLLQPIRDQFANVTCSIDNGRQTGRGYYLDLCCKVHVQTASGEEVEVADGGSVDWTRKLLSNAKERLVISGIGSERVCQLF